MKKNIFNRLLSSILVAILTISYSISALAAESTIKATNATKETYIECKGISSKTTDWLFGMWTNCNSSTAKTYSNFTVAGKAAMKAELNVSAPCVIFIGLLDSNGSTLGYKTMNITQAGTFMFALNPQYLNTGSYKVVFWFDTSGITYDLYLHGYTAN